MAEVSTTAFTFGRNWLEYSAVLDEARVEEARTSVQTLLGRASLNGSTFLDVGAGSGLFSIAALKLGASVTALDRDADCVRAIEANALRFASPEERNRLQIQAGDVLDPATLPPAEFDIVYAWGSLHHTGAMWQAITNAGNLCAPGGLFVLAIYNETWTSPAWLWIKRLYHASPRPVRTLMAAVLAASRALARLALRRSVFTTGRGMTLWYDAVDWLGGLPYEYASAEAVVSFLAPRGFVLERCIPTRRSGCNELVLRRSGQRA